MSLPVLPDNHVAAHPTSLGRGCHDAAGRGIARSRDLVIARNSRQLYARGDAELREHVAEMAIDGVRRDKEALGGLSIRKPLSDEARDSQFRGSQRRPTVRLGFDGDQAPPNAEFAEAAADATRIPACP